MLYHSFSSLSHDLSYPKGKKIGCLWRTFFVSENKNSTSTKISSHCICIWAVAFSTPSVQFANNLSRLSNPFCWYQLGLSFQKSSTELRRKEKSFYFLTGLDWLQGNAVPKLGCEICTVDQTFQNYLTLFQLKVSRSSPKNERMNLFFYPDSPEILETWKSKFKFQVYPVWQYGLWSFQTGGYKIRKIFA